MWTVRVLCLCVIFFSTYQGGSADDARLPPTIYQGPDRQNYYRSDYSFQLVCRARGIPAISYEWTKNGVTFNLNGHNVKHETDGTIAIDPATSLDSGYYQCIAKNQFGTAISNTSYQRLAILDSKPPSDALPVQVTEGEPFFIQAQPIKCVPKPKLSWEIANDIYDPSPTAIVLSSRVQIADNGNLHFAYAKREDDLSGRIYKSTAFNEIMDLSAGGSYTSVTVKALAVPLTPFSPVVAFASDTPTVAIEGNNISLRCFFAGNPEPNIAWTGPKNTLPPGRFQMENANSRLTIRGVQPTDEGDYICTGTNAQGTNRHTIGVRVEAMPKFLSENNRPHDVNITQGQSLTFRCDAYAKPEANILWLRNGQPIDLNHPPRRYVISADRKSLTIQNLCRDCTDRPESSQSDLGIIQCNASNIHGYAFSAGYVNVLLPTTVIITGKKEVDVDANEEATVEFGCTATSDPLTPVVPRWYKEEEKGRQLVYNEPPEVFVKDGLLTIHVGQNDTKAWNKRAETYICIANNNYSEAFDIAKINFRGPPPLPYKNAFTTYWWILLLLLLILLLIIIILICCCCCLRNRGDNYDVDAKERKNGNDPEKELKSNGFHDYQRPEGQTLRGSRGSLGSAGKMPSDDEASLLEFGDDPGKFTEDGSFVGAYASNTAERGGRGGRKE